MGLGYLNHLDPADFPPMKKLWSDWPAIKEKIRKAPKILLISDYDGTLVPITQKPDLAKLNPKTRSILKKIKSHPRFILGIWSGRILADVANLVKLRNIYYSGNHGLEITGAKINFVHPLARKARPELTRVKKSLRLKTKNIPGVILEDKIYTLSLHFRLTPKSSLKELANIFYNQVRPFVLRKYLSISHGKKVWEIRPRVRWNKGLALKCLDRKLGDIPIIYLGDDRTDEDALKVLRKKDIGVFIGRPQWKSRAKYHLTDPRGVTKFLKELLKI